MTAAFDREDESTAVIGDGVVTLDVPIDEKEKKMPVELGKTTYRELESGPLGKGKLKDISSKFNAIVDDMIGLKKKKK